MLNLLTLFCLKKFHEQPLEKRARWCSGQLVSRATSAGPLREVLCVVEKSVDWIDNDEEKIITSEETLDATAPVIYDVPEWIGAGNVLVEDDSEK